ncbi:MAG TPA: 50S ribosomal protein L24 [bacterium]|jgi:large subunit ribosomal protein L24|nr:50S ribosomal protein L24 [bacterium]
MHVHREDTVLILTGKDRGKKGRVIRLFPKVEKALVEKINMVKRHTRPTQQLPQGGILEKEAPVHLSNLQVVCGKCGKATRIAHKVLASGIKTRACKKCGEILDKEK